MFIDYHQTMEPGRVRHNCRLSSSFMARDVYSTACHPLSLCVSPSRRKNVCIHETRHHNNTPVGSAGCSRRASAMADARVGGSHSAARRREHLSAGGRRPSAAAFPPPQRLGCGIDKDAGEFVCERPPTAFPTAFQMFIWGVLHQNAVIWRRHSRYDFRVPSGDFFIQQ